MVSKLKLLVLLLLIQFSLLGQNRFVKRGEKAFGRGEYPEAIAHFRNVKEKTPEINRRTAESYLYLGSYEQAEKYFNNISENEKTAEDLIHLSQIYLANENVEAAILFTKRAEDLGAEPVFIQNRLDAIHDLVTGRNANQDLKARKTEMQPKGKCLGITAFSDGIIFSNTKSGKLGSFKNYQLYFVPYQNSEHQTARLFAGNVETKTDIGATCFSPDGKTMYYTRWYTRKGKQQMEIAVAEKRKDQWVLKGSLGFTNRKYSSCYPSLSSDGNTMYFSSDMPGGFGGMDLYVSQKAGTSWSEPKNLGKPINTEQNEIYPRLFTNGQLWFSSDGHVGYGKLDLFFTSKNTDGTWTRVMNPGFPYNSAFSDYSILDVRNRNALLLVSDREERGLRDRIYKLEQDAKETIRLVVKDAESEAVIRNVAVSIHKLIENQEVAATDQANENGEHSFLVSKSDFNKGILYEIKLSKEAYADKVVAYYPENQNINLNVKMDRLKKGTKLSFVSELTPIAYPDKKMTFRNIYFEANQMELSDEARHVLDKMCLFWKEFPDLGVKINGHSDSKGNEDANLAISLLRAQKAKAYLVEKGIDASKIKLSAWGEQFILNGCFDQSDCSEEEHKENRRLELLFVL